MFINNRLTSFIYKICIIVVCFVGLLMNSGIIGGTFAPYVFLYYTILSNLFCLIFYIISAIFTMVNIKNTGKYGVLKFAPHFKGGVVMAMVLTMLFYFFILSSGSFENVSFSAVFSNIIVHLIVPIMVIVDWVLFDRKGRFTGSDPIIWTVVPFMYYALVLVAAQLQVQYYGGANYPYYFIDPSDPPYGVGWAKVLVTVFLLTLGYVAVGYILLGVDRLLGNQAKKKALEAAHELPDIEGFTIVDADEDDYVPAENLQNLNVLSGAETAPPAQPVPQAAAPATAQPVQRPVSQPVPTPPPASSTPTAPTQNHAAAGQASGSGMDKVYRRPPSQPGE